MNKHFQVISDTVATHQKALTFFHDFVNEWSQVLPAQCDIQHVGATSVEGCITKGDLDICIRVVLDDFKQVKHLLSRRFSLNTGSVTTDEFVAFSEETSDLDLGIQVVVKQSEFDIFVLFRDTLRQSRDLVMQYNALKTRCNGMEMSDYRCEKSEFIEHCLTIYSIDN